MYLLFKRQYAERSMKNTTLYTSCPTESCKKVNGLMKCMFT
jgi:hypothetical protein